ncbi:MAG TPA: MoaD/ThiS family protein [Terriglobales bacterium]|nr:MoaD/ThiS family protein [Terriglobales bacterium]
MPVTFYIPGPLLAFSGGQCRIEIELSPGTVREALAGLSSICPGILDRILTEQGELREHVNVFVGNEEVRYLKGLATPVPANAEITIVQAVSGGLLPEH